MVSAYILSKPHKDVKECMMTLEIILYASFFKNRRLEDLQYFRVRRSVRLDYILTLIHMATCVLEATIFKIQRNGKLGGTN